MNHIKTHKNAFFRMKEITMTHEKIQEKNNLAAILHKMYRNHMQELFLYWSFFSFYRQEFKLCKIGHYSIVALIQKTKDMIAARHFVAYSKGSISY